MKGGARTDIVDAGAAGLHRGILAWYATHARALPWREPDCSPWGVFVSEIMAQQTPLARVEPLWREWMTRWPTPAALAAESPGEVVRAWSRLGYPRRALRLREAAILMVERHGGQVPTGAEELLALPGVGPYTASAVAAFAFAERTTVVDTNVRRVLTRILLGRAQAAPALTAAESALAAATVPADRATSVTWNVAVMELGALICTARAPACHVCPVADRCAWQLAGRPADQGPPRRAQAYEGTDRKVRGDLLQLLRDAPGPLCRNELQEVDPDLSKVDRCLRALLVDGLIEPAGPSAFRLPQ